MSLILGGTEFMLTPPIVHDGDGWRVWIRGQGELSINDMIELANWALGGGMFGFGGMEPLQLKDVTTEQLDELRKIGLQLAGKLGWLVQHINETIRAREGKT